MKAREESAPAKPFAFVIMPFSAEFQDVYQLGIKPACESAGAECSRVDEQIFLQNILERIYGQIARADIVIAEMTGRSANVFYEAGYAHGLGKPVILLTRDANDIPFDLKHYPHIVYQGSISALKAELERRMRWWLEHSAERRAQQRPGADATESRKRMEQHIVNYLNAHGFGMVSFEKLRENVNPNYSDEALLDLIDKSPEQFRRARLSGKRAGIALLGK